MRLLLKLKKQDFIYILEVMRTRLEEQDEPDFEFGEEGKLYEECGKLVYVTYAGKGKYTIIDEDGRLIEFIGFRKSFHDGNMLFTIKKENIEKVVEYESTEPWRDPFSIEDADTFIASEIEVKKAITRIAKIIDVKDEKKLSDFLNYLNEKISLRLKQKTAKQHVYRVMKMPAENVKKLYIEYLQSRKCYTD